MSNFRFCWNIKRAPDMTDKLGYQFYVCSLFRFRCKKNESTKNIRQFDAISFISVNRSDVNSSRGEIGQVYFDIVGFCASNPIRSDRFNYSLHICWPFAYHCVCGENLCSFEFFDFCDRCGFLRAQCAHFLSLIVRIHTKDYRFL